MAPNQDLYDITSKVLLGMRDVLKAYQPEIVFVHGDTTTSMAATIAAFYQQIKVAHIESGLRTYNLYSPWPEEMNRQLTDRLCEYCFAPTEISKKNLLQEKIDANKIYVTGNTVIDALLMAIEIIKTRSGLQDKILYEIKEKGYEINPAKKYILVTGHRRENFGEGFLNICKALKEIAIAHPDMDIVYPVHLNPNVQKPVYELLAGVPNIYLISPLGYLPFVCMMQHSYLILTDSGGVQKEAPCLGKPVLVVQDTTERLETVKTGTVKSTSTDAETIVKSIELLLSEEETYGQMSRAINPYVKT
jgi:UDP-N-acetylglucosamine 2-epimerase (non-hydrolysing)